MLSLSGMKGDTCGLAERTREIEIMMRKVSNLKGVTEV